MKNTKFVLFATLMVVLVFFAGAKTFSGQGSQTFNLLDDVLLRGEIRAGYVVYPPGFIKDPNSGQLSGIFHDVLEEAGKNLGLKINWVEEVGWGTMIEGLSAGRYDIIGSNVWPNSTRARNADFTVPLFYSAVGVYARIHDGRFSDLNRINNKDVTIATIDGEMSSFIARATFPNAKIVSLPQDAQVSQLLLNVTTRKADVTFVETAIAEEFLAHNPGSVHNIVPNQPIRSFGNTMVMPKDQESFKSMMNTALEELFNNGVVNELVAKYEKYPGSFYRLAKPYSAL